MAGLALRTPNQTHRVLTADDMEALAIGAWILGTGGGGDPYHKLLNMRQLYAKGHTVTLIDPMSLADDACIAVVSNMGAPIVGQERLSDPEFSARPVRMMENYLGRKFDAVMALEIGGGNGLQPMLIAALTGLPVVDADTMGRAYPEAQMTSVAVANLKCFPFAMADIRDNEVIIPRAESWTWMERISRKACTEIGSVAATCKAPRTGEEVKKHGVLYTTSKAIRLGETVLEARKNHTDPIEAVLGAAHGKRLFAGKVVDVERRATEGFLRGQAVIEGLEEDVGSTMVLHFQNEFSVAFKDGQPIVMTPDLICALDTVSGEGIGTDVIRFGQRVTVLALPAPPVFLSPDGLKAVGPGAFGFDIEFSSVFEEAQS
ncbi:DUF917 domain-containing protein [Pelagibius litoralis]|uniref:DUF917 domain-containing protein n=1 Tax=Pelagibius litoralis TaxID=374515 RepID=A0A967KI95_9PROT|nr:DUF917 domain-containing protein [Pelagibius litoralis]NIA72061.1 DUF917 domain-containing protein [Pelagibius litoralis]